MAMSKETCCTCAAFLSTRLPEYDEKTTEPLRRDRQLDCCGRIICRECLEGNPRFKSYCPYCQISVEPSPLPTEGLREPPAYHAQGTPHQTDEPPAYSFSDLSAPVPTKVDVPAEDVLHFVDPSRDSISSLALAYKIPQSALRRKNNLFADNLIAARKTVLIPGDLYKGGVSLSPKPLESEEEQIKKTKVRKWMVTTKVADYNMALLYLKQAEYDLNTAIEVFFADEQWEKEHPMAGSSRAQQEGRRRMHLGGGLTGQLA